MPNPELENLFRNRMVQGLRRKSIASCSQWVTMYRVMGQPFPGPYSFKHHPWCKDIHDSKAEVVVGMKAAQMGFTEVGLNKAFYTIDILGSSVLYILPAATPDATDFSSSRFDPALDLSPHLKNMFSDVKNVGHKRAGNASLFIRGSRSRSQMKSLPTPLIIFDELEEMNQDNVILAGERSSGQNWSQQYMLSTPRISNHGIDLYWQQSTQDQFFFKCPHCRRFICMTFPDSLVIDDANIENSHYICTECKCVLMHEEKVNYITLENSEWVQTYTNRDVQGYGISQLYSMTHTTRPSVIAKDVIKAEVDPTVEQELYNSKMGLCHTVKGARVEEDDIKECTGDFMKVNSCSGISWRTMGIDVGPKFLHVEIDEYSMMKQSRYKDIHTLTMCKLLCELKVEKFEDLDQLFSRFNILYAVVDAMPERRESLKFVQRHYGRASMCYYADSVHSKIINENEKEMSVTIGRTVWMDTALCRFKPKIRTIKLPKDLSLEYKEQVIVPTRIYEKDANGNPVGRYISGTKADHFAHARVYSEIALAVGLKMAGNQDITENPS